MFPPAFFIRKLFLHSWIIAAWYLGLHYPFAVFSYNKTVFNSNPDSWAPPECLSCICCSGNFRDQYEAHLHPYSSIAVLCQPWLSMVLQGSHTGGWFNSVYKPSGGHHRCWTVLAGGTRLKIHLNSDRIRAFSCTLSWHWNYLANVQSVLPTMSFKSGAL